MPLTRFAVVTSLIALLRQHSVGVGQVEDLHTGTIVERPKLKFLSTRKFSMWRFS